MTRETSRGAVCFGVCARARSTRTRGVRLRGKSSFLITSLFSRMDVETTTTPRWSLNRRLARFASGAKFAADEMEVNTLVNITDGKRARSRNTHPGDALPRDG